MHLFNNKTEKIVKTYLKSRGFFDNVLDLSNVLKLINDTIRCLESKTANLAECYLGYIKLAVAIKNIFQDHHLMFYHTCISIFNERFRIFDYDEYLLAYYLHPKYRDDLEILKAQLHKYACNEEPYNRSYVSAVDSPTQWWKTTSNGIKDKLGVLSSLAVKLFSVCPHAASCELELTEEEIQTVFQDVTLFSEDIEEESIDDLNEPDNFDDSEELNNDELEEFDEDKLVQRLNRCLIIKCINYKSVKRLF
ncbi:15950_t:CDS:2 [Cetraspora pellucida]|uniref:15950_t:CDS:1 n=1 Tax=Cetraspora pellucida TaxID=1433469 RepID=A0ACA9MFU3_9GLOM|nr:15950_t:CDS:2 [Cetraspora pellucida]